MIKTPIIQPVHSLELGYVELEILAKKRFFALETQTLTETRHGQKGLRKLFLTNFFNVL